MRKKKILELAKELGFVKCGFADAVPFKEEFDLYLEWLEKGYNASMRWMERNLEKRRDVRNIVPGARTVIILAENYFKTDEILKQVQNDKSQNDEILKQVKNDKSQNNEILKQVQNDKSQNNEILKQVQNDKSQNNEILKQVQNDKSQNDEIMKQVQNDKSYKYGRLSRYAWGTDYHDILLPKLKIISESIKNLCPGAATAEYVDTGPVLERQWAVRAGIGWQGKNGCIINKEYGSYFFLGTVITDVYFEPDMPQSDHCGKCTACIDACPTGAIVSPKVIDSRKCLGYWTVEAKPDIEFPSYIQKNQSGALFGCDICQEVCPWNKKASACNEKQFYPRNGETCLSKGYVENMTQEEFSLRFRKSPVKRVKLAGLKRNARYL